MNRTAAAVALIAATALLGACSFSAKTGQYYKSADGLEYTYGEDPNTVKIHYAGLINGRDTVLWKQGAAMASVSCDKPCTKIRLNDLETQAVVGEFPFTPVPSTGNAPLRDMIFDDISYNKLTQDPAAADTINKAVAAAAANPPAAKPAE